MRVISAVCSTKLALTGGRERTLGEERTLSIPSSPHAKYPSEYDPLQCFDVLVICTPVLEVDDWVPN
jgi:hypothetical protein